MNLCESTRTVYNADCLSDVFHGRVWSKFLEIDGQKFLSLPFTYGVTINIDWFEPFKHYTYSVGVIYLVVMNLPRSVRYKRKNIILVGVIPGPKEPSLTINTYLAPLVSELLQLWRGLSFNVYGSTAQQIVRVALLVVACDLPAGRKVCGFLSHSANLGCSRCYCTFAQGFGCRDYSNFDRDLWELRTNERHRKDISELSKCKTKTERAHKQSEIGCRFSELLRLPYFDPVNMLIIDPMHNLFLGSAKYITKEIWIKKGILNAASLDVIHERIKRIQVPLHIGRLPERIESGTTFTAEQWMNWTLYYSVYCLFGLLSTEMMECWRHFVLACRRLCKGNLTPDDVTIADALLMQFDRRVGHLYGRDCITPNIHMHAHLTSCVRDYGPLHGFWLFSFERYNGILGSQPNNNRSIEIQLMNRFLKDNMHLHLLHLAESKPLIDVFNEVVSQHASHFDSVDVTATDPSQPLVCSEPTSYTLTVLPEECISVLNSVYSILHPDIRMPSVLPATVKKFSSIQVNGYKLSSMSEKKRKLCPIRLGISCVSISWQ